jgi:ubiquinone/menaquinone biosynthesis C-methylase UbiE
MRARYRCEAARVYDHAMEPDEYRRASLENWKAMAPGWEQWREELAEFTAPVRDWMLSAVAPKPGDTVLELAAGPGDTGLAAAAILGQHGRLISTDFSPDMVEVARRHSVELGLGNVEHRVMDAEHIELEDDSVDSVLCRFGYMLMVDAAAALSETRRVLRQGGRLALGVWYSAERNPWASIAGGMLVRRGHVQPAEPDAPGMFSMASEARTRELLENARFSDVHIEEVPVRFVCSDVDGYIRQMRDMGGAFSKAFRDVSEDERESMRAQLQSEFEPFAVDEGYDLPGVALVVVAS